MKITLTREAAYQLRDKLNDILGVDEETPLELYKLSIATEGSAEDYPYDSANGHVHGRRSRPLATFCYGAEVPNGN